MLYPMPHRPSKPDGGMNDNLEDDDLVILDQDEDRVHNELLDAMNRQVDFEEESKGLDFDRSSTFVMTQDQHEEKTEQIAQP